MTDTSNIQLDLDALAPKEVQINYKGKLIPVPSPTLEQFAKIMSVSAEMRGIANLKDDVSQVVPIYDKALAIIREVVPAFQDENLNYMQIMALFKLLGDLAAPDDDKAIAELKNRGIDLAGAEASTSPKASAS